MMSSTQIHQQQGMHTQPVLVSWLGNDGLTIELSAIALVVPRRIAPISLEAGARGAPREGASHRATDPPHSDFTALRR